MPAYNLTIRVPDEEKLAIIIGALSGAGTIMSLAAVSESKDKPTSRFVDGKRNKGILGKDLLLALFKKQQVWEVKNIQAEFVKAGFSANSSSPRLADLKEKGLISLVSPGIYKYGK